MPTNEGVAKENYAKRKYNGADFPVRTNEGITIDKLMAFEDGQLDVMEQIDLLQRLIDTGLAWTLQGFYGRAASACIESGECHP